MQKIGVNTINPNNKQSRFIFTKSLSSKEPTDLQVIPQASLRCSVWLILPQKCPLQLLEGLELFAALAVWWGQPGTDTLDEQMRQWHCPVTLCISPPPLYRLTLSASSSKDPHWL